MASPKENSKMTVPVRKVVYDTNGTTQLSNTNAVEIEVKALLIAAFSSIPSQAASTATAADIVTALKTLP